MSRIAFNSPVGERVGDADGNYDVLVVVTDDASPDRRRNRLGYEVLRGGGHGGGWTLKSSLPGTALREGELIYGG